jgi:hypothetical protein
MLRSLAQGQNVRHQVPGVAREDVLVVGLVEDVGVGRHRRAADAGHEGAVDVLRRRSALELPLGEVEGFLRIAPDVGIEGARRRPVTLASRTVARGAVEHHVEFGAAGDGLGRSQAGWRPRNVDRRAGAARAPLRIERLDVLDQRQALALREQRPVRHRGAVDAAGDDLVEILVGR